MKAKNPLVTVQSKWWWWGQCCWYSGLRGSTRLWGAGPGKGGAPCVCLCVCVWRTHAPSLPSVDRSQTPMTDKTSHMHPSHLRACRHILSYYKKIGPHIKKGVKKRIGEAIILWWAPLSLLPFPHPHHQPANGGGETRPLRLTPLKRVQHVLSDPEWLVAVFYVEWCPTTLCFLSFFLYVISHPTLPCPACPPGVWMGSTLTHWSQPWEGVLR